MEKYDIIDIYRKYLSSDSDFIPSHDLIFRVLYSKTKYHWKLVSTNNVALLYPRSPKWRGVYCFTSVLSSVQDIFRHIFLSNYWWQKSDIWSQASYRYTILWVAFLNLSDSFFLFADLVGFYTHWTYMHIFLSNYWWQKSDIWSQASYRYPYRGKRFWTHQIPTSCLPILLIFIHI